MALISVTALFNVAVGVLAVLLTAKREKEMWFVVCHLKRRKENVSLLARIQFVLFALKITARLDVKAWRKTLSWLML